VKLKQALTNIAPLLGSLIGGPLGNTAGQAVSQLLLGKPKASGRELEQALNNISAEQSIKLKALDAEYQTKLLNLQLDAKRVSLQDRNSARQRALSTQDKVPAILAILMTLGFFATLGLMMFVPLQESAQGVMDVMLGSLGTAWISCIAYYFGASYRQRKNGNGNGNGNGHR